ncbi:MAG TPA: MFS transporter [Solirubrobacterales bacterium]|nr:MFS transporter [Solirubrobacterales bacterium]
MARKWWTLVLISIATFMLLMDVTVVNVALPDIQRDLGASLSSLQWVVDAYSLMLAALLLTAGSLGDRLGRRRVFSIGLGVFTGASFLCGISGEPTLLNLARGLQGCGGAAMFATSLALIGQEFHGRDRATAFGIWGATVGGAVAIGPLVGGVITEHLGWEWIFFVNIPIGVAAVALTELRLVNVAAQDAQRIDLPGLATFSGGLFLLIFGLIRGNPEGWGSATIVASLAGAVALLLAFLAIEARSSHPMLELALFRKPAFNGVSAVAFGLSAGMFAMFLYLTIYMQGVLDFSPLETGLRFLPLTVLSFIVAPIAGRLSHRVPLRVLMGIGLALVGVGLLLMHGLAADSGISALLPGFLVAGVGIGLTNPSIGQAAIAVVPPAKAGMGSGINTTFRQVGIATGVASLGAVFQSQVDSKLSSLVPAAPPGLAEAVSSGGSRAAAIAAPPAQRPEIVHAAKVAFVSGFNEILLIGAILSFAGAALGFALVRASDFVPAQGETELAEPVPA